MGWTFADHLRALDLYNFEQAILALDAQGISLTLQLDKGKWDCTLVGPGGVSVAAEQEHAGEAVRKALRTQRRQIAAKRQKDKR